MDEDAVDTVIDLTGVFADVDSTLTYSAVSNDGSRVMASVSGTGLTLSFVSDANGSTTVTVTASDGDLTVSDMFDVTVTPVNDATVFSGDTSGSGAEDGGNITGDLDATDADGLSGNFFSIVAGDGATNGSAVPSPDRPGTERTV